MTTAGDTQGQIGDVMEGSRGDFSAKDKPVTGINRSMLFQTKMGNIISHGPVRFKITGEFKRIAVFIQFTLRRFSFFPFLLQFFSERGRLVDCTRRASMAMPS